MKLYATSFCVLMLFGAGIACNDEDKEVRVIDRSCDIEAVKLPPHWRAECVGPDKKLRTDVPLATRRACQKLLANERILKKRCR